ncbi:MAG: hypothetical protein CBD18_00080 [Opitutales bacterium TMED158]|nr:MAG: hypothetical protein CBD18_00080 [Opitutales bacterium TMED158]
MNAFYNEYDVEPLGEGPSRPQDYRTPFQIDRDRIIHSSAFRKLQSKTQVYLSGEYDFYRTRLTHSIEVAQIGRSICQYLKSSSDCLDERFYIDADLVEACCLSHDLGHPPFGHGGERTLHRLFEKIDGFEGNAQTLRLVADTLYVTHGRQMGMAPTRAFLDGVMKYKSTRSERGNPRNHFLYDFQRGYRDFVHEADASLLGEQTDGAFKRISSIECQLMDWSDDTAYCINDIVDGVRAGFITIERLERWASRVGLDAESQPLFDAFVADVRGDRLEATFAKKIGTFIAACRLVPAENSLSKATQRYAFELIVDTQSMRTARFYKKIALDLIFRSAPLQQMDYKGDRVLEDLFGALRDSYFDKGNPSGSILPEKAARLMAAADGDEAAKRLVGRDFLAGLTDGQALRMHKRLYDPEYASIVDLD